MVEHWLWPFRDGTWQEMLKRIAIILELALLAAGFYVAWRLFGSLCLKGVPFMRSIELIVGFAIGWLVCGILIRRDAKKIQKPPKK